MATVVIDEGAIQGGDTAPNPPTNLTTEKEWDAVRLHWDNPSNKDIAYIEVWRSTTNDRATATMVAEVKANDYTDHSLETGTRYYWIRAMSTTGLESTWHPTSSTGGVSGTPDQVAVTSAADKHLLQYDSATNTWVNDYLRHESRLKGEIQASTNDAYVFPPQTLNTVTDNNGYSAVSSMPAGTNGYGANAGFTHYFGDTLAGNGTTGAFQFRTANGNSTTDTVPFTGIAGVAPSASLSNNTLGTINFNGYGTTGFTNDTATQYQGGGINAMHSLQFQSYAAENFSDSTLTIAAANISYTSRFRAALGSPSVTGTKGQISFTSTTPSVGNAIRVTGTLTGTATGIVSGQDYYIIATNGSTTATLSATPGGSPIDTTAGTLTGLSLFRCGVTFTLSGQTSVPFGRGALVAVSGVNNVTSGTYPVVGTPTTTTLLLGIPHDSTAPSVSGSQSFSCLTTYMAGGYRIRAFPLATPANFQNRVEIVNHTVAAATHRADTITLQQGTSTTNHLVLDTAKATFTKPVVFPTYTVAGAGALTGAAGWQICISDSTGNGGRMAYWDTTNSRWNYVSDDTAV